MSWSNNALFTFDYIFGNKIIPVAILSWLCAVTYFPVYKVSSLFDLQCFYRNSWKAFLVQIILCEFFIFDVHLNVVLCLAEKKKMVI